MCYYVLPRGVNRGQQCKNYIAEGQTFCTFHASIHAREMNGKRVDKWLHCIIPKPEHASLAYDKIPEEEYPEYLSWYEDHTPYQSDDDENEVSDDVRR